MAKYPAIGDVRAVGCFMAVEFVKDRVTKDRDPELQTRVANACVQRGLLLDPSTTSLNIQPSLMMPVDVMGTVLDILDEAIADSVGSGA